MVAHLSRSGIVRNNDPHGWNSFHNYVIIHEKLLSEHPFLDYSLPSTIIFREDRSEGIPRIRAEGVGYCRRDVILEFEKRLDIRYRGNILQVRAYSYIYVARIEGVGLVLKYHNHHANPAAYIHRAYNPLTGEQILYEELTRLQFPVFSEVLDEAELLTRPPAK